MIGHSLVKNNTIPWCFGKSLKLVDPPGPLKGLFSYPGSGNHWLRYLIQKTTGYVTGSDHRLTTKDGIYIFTKSDSFFHHGFPGEIINDGSAVVVKSHLMIYSYKKM